MAVSKKVSKAAKRVEAAKAASKPRGVRRFNTDKPLNLPDGYKVLERAPNWDVDDIAIINGVRGETNEMTFGRGTRNEYEAECFVVKDKTAGDVTVWRSSGLNQLFEESQEGDEVYIEFLGYGEAKDDDQSPPKLFRTAMKAGKNNKNPF